MKDAGTTYAKVWSFAAPTTYYYWYLHSVIVLQSVTVIYFTMFLCNKSEQCPQTPDPLALLAFFVILRSLLHRRGTRPLLPRSSFPAGLVPRSSLCRTAPTFPSPTARCPARPVPPCLLSEVSRSPPRLVLLPLVPHPPCDGEAMRLFHLSEQEIRQRAHLPCPPGSSQCSSPFNTVLFATLAPSRLLALAAPFHSAAIDDGEIFLTRIKK